VHERAISREPLSVAELWAMCDEYSDRVLPETLGVTVKVRDRV
jgi:hypothetical protein